MEAKINLKPIIQKIQEDLEKLDNRITKLKEKSIKDMVTDLINKSSAKKN